MTALDHTRSPDLEGKALTVLGAIDPAGLGHTLMHEHLFVDLRRPAHALRPGEDAPEAAEPLTLANLAAVRNGAPNADNDLLDDLDMLIEEVHDFADAGGRTIVDVTGMHMGRDPEKLKALSEHTGLHVVMGGGYYTPTFHPLDMAERAVDAIAAEIAEEIISGVGDTGVRPGIIGEIGAEDAPLGDAEWKSIRASARASRITGAPMTFHHGGQGEEKLDVIRACMDEGVPPENIVMGHAGGLAADLDLARKVLATGVFIEFDFLASPGSPWGHLVLMGDHQITRGLVHLLDAGFASQIVLGHDVCQKIQLKRYGGKGFDYITRHMLPELTRLGASKEAIEMLMVSNPARALAFAAPGPTEG